MKTKSKIASVIMALMLSTGIATAAEPVTHIPEQNIGGVVASIALVGAYVAQSNAQGVLPCHSKSDVKVKMKGSNLSYMATDCEVNGFK